MRRLHRYRWRLMTVCLSATIVALAVWVAKGDNPDDHLPTPPEVGTISHPPIREASGWVKSRRFDDVYWTLSDSGNPAHLYALERTGKLIAEFAVKGAPNIDWEALTQDDAGHLFIGDVGNNGIPFYLSRRQIYEVDEPDPRVPFEPTKEQPRRALAVRHKYDFGFPKKPFDIEGIFWHDQQLYLVSKTRRDQAGLYRLKLEEPAATELEFVCPVPGLEYVTGASLSNDGRRLALCSYRYAAVYALPATGDRWQLDKLEPRVMRFGPTAIEDCCWNGNELLMVSEDRTIYALDVKE
ncbi:MAG TPA: hypothetical protein VHB77_22760 [Planctomycetaceae bacterium]|nr:hypothetical protein [Planctomycetaceae bacterium]